MPNDTFMPFDDLPNSAPPDAGPCEPAFRRGYQQGAHFIVEAVKNGVPIADIEHFVRYDLQGWRDHSSMPAYPPEISGPNKWQAPKTD